MPIQQRIPEKIRVFSPHLLKGAAPAKRPLPDMGSSTLVLPDPRTQTVFYVWVFCTVSLYHVCAAPLKEAQDALELELQTCN